MKSVYALWIERLARTDVECENLDMEIKILGCSGGEFPGKSLPGFLLNESILFDAGSLTRKLDFEGQFKINHIFITHAHLDHVIGIPFLLDHITVGKIRHQVNILSIFSVIRTLKQNILNNSVWPDFTVIPDLHHGIVNFIKLKTGQSIKIDHFSITPYKVHHSVPAVGYLIEDKKGRALFYSGDTGPTSSTWRQLRKKKLKGLILETSFPNELEEIALKSGHLTPDLLKKELSRMESLPERIYVTHLKPQYFKTIQQQLRRLGIKNLRLLKDGETFKI